MDNGGELEREGVLCRRNELLRKFDLRKEKVVTNDDGMHGSCGLRQGEGRGGQQCKGNETHDVGMIGEILEDRHLAPSVLLVSLDRLLRNDLQ